MLLSKSFTSKAFSVCIVSILLLLAYSTSINDLLHLNKEETIKILDEETFATIISVRKEKKSELLKGSFLDYEGIYISYEFSADDELFQKTELIKKSDGNYSEFLNSFDLNESSNNKMIVRYNSADPRHSAIDISQALASY